MLLNEPFWVPRAEIGELCDWHVWEQYVLPVLRARRGKKGRRRVKGKAKRLPTRQEYIDTGVQLGGAPEDLGRAYDQWAASEQGAAALEAQ